VAVRRVDRDHEPAVTRPRHIVTAGLMGSGKTTLGRELAERLGRRFVDSDVALQREDGRTAREIAAQDGVDVLHELEAAGLLAALRASEPSVIAAAASTIEDPAARRALGAPETFVIWLRGSPEVLAARAAKGDHRPTGPLAELEAQVERRGPLFAEVADAIVDVDERSPEQVLDAALSAIPDDRPPDPGVSSGAGS
jgi:shikimate kinase